MNERQLIGLVIFLSAIALDIALLLADAWLKAMRLPTISRHVWGDRPLGWPIVLLNVVGTAGLALHFWG